MPNGISCAYFALKNAKVAKEDENIFRGGIAGIQAVRAADALTTTIGALPAASVLALGGKVPKANVPAGASFSSTLPPFCQKASKVLTSMANTGKKLVYPLIITSGVFNTLRSDDKVKTGFAQATGIGLMYSAEKLAEKILVPCTSKIEALATNKPALKGLWAVARGLLYVGASLGGYEIGNRIASSYVDKLRKNKAEKIKEKMNTINNNPVSSSDNTVFSTMKLG